MSIPHPTFDDVLRAKEIIRPYLPKTPLLSYPALDALVGAQVFVKREDIQPTSAFKIRGGVNILASLSDEERARGVICASTGNLGQAIAKSSQMFGARCIVGVPVGCNPMKVAGMHAYGAEVVFHGANFDEARRHVEMLADAEGYRYVHSANEPLLVSGVATETLEVLEDVPDLDYLFVPFGGGSGVSGATIVVKGLGAKTRVVAVQSAQAAAAYESWRQRSIVELPTTTEAEGLATTSGYELTLSIILENLRDFILVDDAEMRAAVGHYFALCHCVAEISGAAALAGALQWREQIAGKKVGVILSGANLTVPQMQRILAEREGIS
ncbi:MAG: threonine/serine dehydratase [Dehalococcoidia bacterium]